MGQEFEQILQHRTIIGGPDADRHGDLLQSIEANDVHGPLIVIFVELHSIMDAEIPPEFVYEHGLARAMQRSNLSLV